MKVRKNANQRNFIIDKDNYTKYEIEHFLNNNVIYWLDENLEQHSDLPEWWKFDETQFIIFASDCEEIKVVYDEEYGFYKTIVITKTGEKINITL